MYKKLTNLLFKVDSRALGVYRILLGWLCFWDIFRRWDFIDIFYSDLGIKSQYAKNTSFSIFNYIGNDSNFVHLIFIIGIYQPQLVGHLLQLMLQGSESVEMEFQMKVMLI